MQFKETARVLGARDENGNHIATGKIVRSTQERSCHGVTSGLIQGDWRTRNNEKPLKVVRRVAQ